MTTINNNLKITWARRQEIQYIARETLKKYNVVAPPANPKKILMGIGELYGFNDPEEKGFTRYKDGKYSIYINTVYYKYMVVWTYAHELGHIVLDHFHLGYGYLTSDFDCKLLDEEANIFAAEFLMQESWIKKYTNLLSPSEAKNLGKLKDLFKVSWDSLLNRLDNLKIQSKGISTAILDLNYNKQNESLYTEFIDETDNYVYDKLGLAANDDRIGIMSTEKFTSSIINLSSNSEAKDISFSDSEHYITLADNSAEYSKEMFCGNDEPIRSFTPNTYSYLDSDVETYDWNRKMLLSLEEAFLNPDNIRYPIHDYDEWP